MENENQEVGRYQIALTSNSDTAGVIYEVIFDTKTGEVMNRCCVPVNKVYYVNDYGLSDKDPITGKWKKRG